AIRVGRRRDQTTQNPLTRTRVRPHPVVLGGLLAGVAGVIAALAVTTGILGGSKTSIPPITQSTVRSVTASPLDIFRSSLVARAVDRRAARRSAPHKAPHRARRPRARR